MPLEPGSKFSRYTIEALLGEGGMGQVYRAFDARLERRVALKILRPRISAETDKSRADHWILREARAAAALDHPNAVSIFELDEHDGMPFMAMELISGKSLRSYVGRRGVPLEQRARWLGEIARALDAAHQAGIIHLDIKPENVMVRSSDAVVKVLDFGVARRTSIDGEGPEAMVSGEVGKLMTLTGRGVLVGTPPYMAPEQVKRKVLDGRADQFAWGVLAYELLAGKTPWPAEGPLFEVLSAIVEQPPPSLSGAVQGELPDAMVAAVMRALSKDPSDRFPTMAEAADALLSPLALRSSTPSWSGVEPRIIRVGLSSKSETLGGIETKPIDGDTRPVNESDVTRTLDPDVDARAQLATMQNPDSVVERASGPVTDRRIEPVASTKKTPIAPETVAPSPSAAPTPEPTPAPTPTPAPVVAPRPRFRLGAVLAGTALVGALVATVIHERQPPPAPPAVSTVLAAPAPTAITELPDPRRCNEAALRDYRASVRALRDGSWEQAHAGFERAVAADPECAEAYLRLSITGHYSYPISKAREVYGHAVRLRDNLGVRDQGLLGALEPLLRRDPADEHEYAERLRKLSVAFPGDAELACLAADYEDDLDRKLAAIHAALKLDPHYSDGWQILADTLTLQGKTDEALAALGDCLREAPNSMDCLAEQSALLQRVGRCGEMEATARQWIARDPRSPAAYQTLAGALSSIGKPEAAMEALRQRWTKIASDEDRDQKRLYEQALFSALQGDFEGASRSAHDLASLVEADPNFERHVRPTLLLADLLVETHREAQAGTLAVEFLKRKGAWSVNLTPGGSEVRLTYVEPLLLRVARRAKRLTQPEWEAAHGAWVEQTRKSGTFTAEALWAMGSAMPAETKAEADAAIRAMPASLKQSGGRLRAPMELSGAFAGRALLLAGRIDDALPFLQVAASSCFALDDPFVHTQAHLWLGQALEQKGDNAGACAAYRVVTSRWGSAATRSSTADVARRRLEALACR